MRKRHAAFLILALALSLAAARLPAQEPTAKPQRAVITLDGKLEAMPPFTAEDFLVEAGKKKGPPTRIYAPGELPTLIALVLQDNQPAEFGAQLPALREFILRQPPNTYVGVFYLTAQSLDPALPPPHFFSDLPMVANALRSPKGLRESAPPSPYDQLAPLLDYMNRLPDARKEVLLFSEGSDVIAAQADAPPSQNASLRRALKAAQQGGMPVWAIYTVALVPEVRLQEVGEGVLGQQGLGRQAASVQSGQFDPNAQTPFSAGSAASGIAYLTYMTGSSGGKVFSPGKFAVDIKPFLEEFQRLLTQQVVLEFPGDEPPKKIKLTRKLSGVKLLYPQR